MKYNGKRSGFGNIGKITGSLGDHGMDKSVEHYLGYYLIAQKLEKVFKQVLDVALQDKVSIASYEEGKLGVFCNDATSASILRYASNDYIKKLQDYPMFENINAIQVRVKIKNT